MDEETTIQVEAPIIPDQAEEVGVVEPVPGVETPVEETPNETAPTEAAPAE